MDLITLRLYASLNRYLPADRRQMDITRPIQPGDTIADVLAGLGVPAAEVRFVLHNGNPARLDTPPQPGDRISVYPAFQQIDTL